MAQHLRPRAKTIDQPGNLSPLLFGGSFQQLLQLTPCAVEMAVLSFHLRTLRGQQRPSTCNTVETLLVHRNIADTFLPALSKQMAESGVTLHAAPSALPALQNGPAKVEPVKAEQYDDEYLSLDLNVKVVADMDEAIAHIREHGTQHSDAILTRTLRNANRFINEVDSSAVYVNASTRFTDGGQFGLGAEVAVSTQKLHARGPMGLEALTTYKWIGFGDDTIRA